MPEKTKIAIMGSGNWGTAIAKIIGSNVLKFPYFDPEVRMYVYEELIEGRKLTEVINTKHENVKYLPGIALPESVVADPSISHTAENADVIVFVVPHQFISGICKELIGKIKPNAIGISLIKGFERAEGGGIELISRVINRATQLPMSVLMGANIANEVAEEQFCETTIACRNKEHGLMFHDLFQTDYFRVVVVDDVETVEICGALKNVVACAAGFVDGLEMGDNTKAAIIRLGLMEMIKYCEVFYPGSKITTFFESCGVADLITTCYGGRNRKVSEAFVKTKKTMKQLEEEMLNGQRLQGPYTADEVNYMLKNRKMEDRFPLFTAVYRIANSEVPPEELINLIRNHPEHQPGQKRKACDCPRP